MTAPVVRVTGQLPVALLDLPEDGEWVPVFVCAVCNRTIGPEGGQLLYQRPIGAGTSTGMSTVHHGQCLELADPHGQFWRVELPWIAGQLAANTR